MSDLAKLTGQPKNMTVNGKTYAVYPLKIGDLGKLQAWVNEQYGDPVAIALEHCEGLTMVRQKFLMQSALEQAAKPKPKLGSAEATELLNSYEGLAETFYLSIAKGDPAFTREMAAQLVDDMTPESLAMLQEQTEVSAVMPDPKAPTTGEAPPG